MSSSAESSVEFNPRVTPRLLPALGGVFRLTWAQQMLPRNIIMAVLVVAGFSAVGYLMGKSGSTGFINWIDRMLLLICVPIFAFETGARAIREDLKPGAVDYVITRSLPRWAYPLFKYISQWVVLALLGTATLGVLLLIGRFLDIEVGSVFVRTGVLLAGLSAFQALGFFLGCLTSRYLLLGLLYAGVVEAAVGAVPVQLNNLSILRHLMIALDGYNPAAELGLVILIALGLLAAATGWFVRLEFIGKKSDEA